MLFKLYDIENKEYLIPYKKNLSNIIVELNVIYHYEEDFVDLTMDSIGDFLLNARLQLLPFNE